ncbi:MAG: hypothetical protein WBD40_04055, partial [Tepidisphaeraceae bacterium]
AGLPRVLVLPFEEFGDSPARQWIGKAIQQSLVAELTRGGLVSVVTPTAQSKPPKDAAAAAQSARDVQAPLVITGSYQIVNDDLRVTGQMLESINGEPVSGIKATGNLRDLFGIEDIIGAQVKRDLMAILQPQPSTQPSPQEGRPGDPFARGPGAMPPSGPVRTATPSGAYDGSELQRALDPRWTPPQDPYLQSAYDRYRYNYPSGPYYPPYGYYDYCGYRPWPIVVRPVRPGRPIIVPTPLPQRLPPNGNFAIHPPHNMQGEPGQLGRPGGGNTMQGQPGQLGRPGGGNSMGASGQSGRSSGGNTMKNASSR